MVAVLTAFVRNVWMVPVIVGCSAALYFQVRHDHSLRLPFLDEISPEHTVAVEVEGVVVDEPRLIVGARGNLSSCRLRLDWMAQDGGREDAGRRCVRALLSGTDGLRYGDRVRVRGALGVPEAPRNPGQFDFAGWLAKTGVHAELVALAPEDVSLLGHGEANLLKAKALAAREWIRSAITLDLIPDDPDVAGVIAAMVLGTREDAPDELLRDFRFSGTLHIFAVSGLHVGMIALILIELFKVVRVPRRAAALLVMVALLAYAFVTGLRPSAVRAAVMAAVLLFGRVIDRPARLPNSLGAAALVILAFDPYQALMPGFQLSFAVLAAIAFLSFRIEGLLRPLVSPDPFLPKSLIPAGRMRLFEGAQLVVAYFSMSLAAWTGSTLLIALYFHLVTPVAILANIVLVPLAFLVIFTAVTSVLVQAFPLKGLGVLFNNANFLLVKGISLFIGVAAAVPGGYFFVTKPGVLRAHCEIGVFDIPRGGGAAHVHTSTAGRWQIDTGPERTYESIVLPYLQEMGLNRLDGLLVSHADSDHVGAAPTLARDYRPRVIAANVRDQRSPSLTALAVDRPLVRGDEFQIDGRTRMTVLFPPADHDAPLADDRCAVIRLDCDGWRVLFTGDAGFATENWLLEHGDPDELRSDVLVRGINRLGPSGDLGFVARVAPRAIVASNTPFRENERLPPRWQADVRALGIDLFDQAETGFVKIAIDGDRLTLSAFVTDKEARFERQAQ